MNRLVIILDRNHILPPVSYIRNKTKKFKILNISKNLLQLLSFETLFQFQPINAMFYIFQEGIMCFFSSVNVF
jgi:hypothetical protein